MTNLPFNCQSIAQIRNQPASSEPGGEETISISQDCGDIVESLLKGGVAANSPFFNRHTGLMIAAERRDLDISRSF
ncbi:MAG: hypothetical protein ACTMUB_01790 [cyanobacterium endosymbiont of Rhopalodia musculus]|uniref:hypothetical protein n=1 Tax=cyanobacterium endosymbiont of Epithemia clementina EcSB TaxID=3034674 RepID=UPI0024804997|nr:hypothetical protein [cyanobacterium endosymbiont of Epithemia clementina EcSB]WGT66977.1 hypothetical protein P3F56_06985 [cyanobacterium endosymbiont of Epithemia clementina EcSB]